MGKSSEELQHHMNGIAFPAGKEEIAAAAEGNSAPQTSSTRSGMRTGNGSTIRSKSFRRCEAFCRGNLEGFLTKTYFSLQLS